MICWHAADSGRFAVSGLGWTREGFGGYDASGNLFARLPAKAQADISAELWDWAQKPSGVALRFTSDTRALHIRTAHGFVPPWGYLSQLGYSGMDLYVRDGTTFAYWGTSFPNYGEEPYEHCFFPSIDAGLREFVLYVSCYNYIAQLDIGLDAAATIARPGPYACGKPVVFYGSSIVQGACASRPGNTYPAIVSRALNVEAVNLGFGGNGLGEPAVAKLLGDIDAACYVLDYHVNLTTGAALQQVYEPFYRLLRGRRPETPIVLISPYEYTQERVDAARQTEMERMRHVIRSVYHLGITEGDCHLYYINGKHLLHAGEEGVYADGLHPNDYGFHKVAARLVPLLKPLLMRYQGE